MVAELTKIQFTYEFCSSWSVFLSKFGSNSHLSETFGIREIYELLYRNFVEIVINPSMTLVSLQKPLKE